MRQKLYLFAALAAMLAACSENDLGKETAAVQNAEPGAVTFDVYTNRATTRAGWAGEVTTNGLKEQTDDAAKLGASGFGVFGYYTNNNTYDQQAIPNFFYNQQVKYTGSDFTYEPVKYWPNEYGTTAISDDADKVSFFAYAPWVEVVPSTGKVTANSEDQKWGINSMTRNSATGDPLVKYLVAFDPTRSVDLCWGVCDNTSWPQVLTGDNQKINNGESGLPWLNVERPADATGSQKLKFTFKHALAKLNVQVDTYVDGVSTDNVATGTKVFVRSITFEGLADKGALNLNNTESGANKAYWMDYAGTNDLVTGEDVTIYDGRKDGKEGTLGGEATNEKVLGLNPQLVQSTLWAATKNTTGVLGSAQNLFRKWNPTGGLEGKGAYEAAGLNEPVYVIPTGDAVKVTIVYDVETADKNLATYLSDSEQLGSSIENRISKTITFGKDESGKTVTMLENGKAYTLKLHLGMNSVKFDAAVTTWENNSANDVDLPANVPVYAAAPTPTTNEVTVPYTSGTFQFGISGLDPYETIAAPSKVDNLTFATSTANASGIALETVTIGVNNTVKNVENASAVEFGSTNKVSIKFTQEAHPLGLGVKNVVFASNEIVLSSTASGIKWNTDIVNKETDVTVLKNGVKLTTVVGTAPTATTVKYIGVDGNTNSSLILSETPAAGDVYSITVKAGDAEAETFTVTIGYINFVKETLGLIKDGTGNVALNNFGNGKVTYTSDAPTVAEVDENTGIVTAKKKGNSTITATVVNTPNCFYPTNTATYKVGIGDVVIGNDYLIQDVVKTSAPAQQVIISGLTPGEIVTTQVADGGGWITISPTNPSSPQGRCTVNFSVADNDGSSERSTTIIVKTASGTTVITVKQLGS